MTSSWISIDAGDGKTFDGYLALPPTGTGPAILLIQEIFGVNAHIRSVADQYASAGFVVLAPDMFWRQTKRIELAYSGDDFKHGIELMQKMDFGLAVQDLAAAARTLKAHEAVKGKLASVGYCMGGLLSYLCAAKGGVDAAVCYYPGGVNNQLGLAGDIKVPVQFNFGALDSHIGKDVVEAVKSTFAGRDNVSVHVYDNADHGFNCWARSSYNQKAATLALGHALAFLSKTVC